jgi:PIN domain nuclease of toxin-antitoxin system
LFLSSVSVWEIPISGPPERFIPAQRIEHEIETLQMEEKAALYIERLFEFHKDPFDHMPVRDRSRQGLL